MTGPRFDKSAGICPHKVIHRKLPWSAQPGLPVSSRRRDFRAV